MGICRPLAAACASCMCTLLLYPLDTRRAFKQLGVVAPPRAPYAGSVADAIGSFAAAGAYFAVYEAEIAREGSAHVPIASLVATCASGVPHAPLDVCKQRRRARLNGLAIRERGASPALLLRCYALSVSRAAPKTMLKYSLYEAMLRAGLAMGMPAPLVGCVGAMLASVLSSTLFVPLDVLKAHVVLERRAPRRIAFRGVRESIAISAIGNAIGHGLLELLAPR